MHFPLQFLAMDTKEEIKSRLSIVDVVGDYATLHPNGSSGFKCLCPFHDDHSPSMIVNDKKNFAWCFACNSGGDIFGFVQKIENCSFPEALRLLAEKANVPLENIKIPTKKDEDEKERLFVIMETATEYFEKNLLASERAQKILAERSIPEEITQRFRVGFAPKSDDGLLKFLLEKGFSRAEMEKSGLVVPDENGREKDKFRDRVMFPIWNSRGRICAFGGRYIGDFENAPKYLNSPETPIYKKSDTLYGMRNVAEILRSKKSAILVEGYFDALALVAVGFENVVASCGTALTEGHVKWLRRSVDTLFFALDVDEAGQYAARKSAGIALKNNLGIGIIKIPGGKDPDEARRENEAELKNAVANPDLGVDAFLARSFNLRNSKNLDDKKAICEEIFPLLNALQSEIDRDHFFQKLAEKLEIRVEVLEKEFLKNPEITSQKPKQLPSEKKCSLLEYFSGLLFARPEDFLGIAKVQFPLELLPAGDERKMLKIFWENDGKIDEIPTEFLDIAKRQALFAEEKIKNFPEDVQKKEFEKTLRNLLEKLVVAKQKELSAQLTQENFAETIAQINELNKVRQKMG